MVDVAISSLKPAHVCGKNNMRSRDSSQFRNSLCNFIARPVTPKHHNDSTSIVFYRRLCNRTMTSRTRYWIQTTFGTVSRIRHLVQCAAAPLSLVLLPIQPVIHFRAYIQHIMSIAVQVLTMGLYEYRATIVTRPTALPGTQCEVRYTIVCAGYLPLGLLSQRIRMNSRPCYAHRLTCYSLWSLF